MTKRMLVDATHPEETRVAIVDSYRDNNKLEDLDFGLASKPVLRGNIYLAKVMRIEPSLQAAFVEYGGNRHGFLPFSEIHQDYFRIPMADRPQDEEQEEQAETPYTDANKEPDAPVNEDIPGNDNGISPDDDLEVPVEENYLGEPETEPEPLRPQTESEPTPQPLPEKFGPSSDVDVGLITDFGNAAIPPMSLGEPAPIEATPVESVGGDVAERFVRQHRPRYKIQEVLKRGQVMLVQVVKEERGNKGAALTTYLSLAGRYCVLMPNTDHGGGVSRKITNHHDRRRMKEILDQLEVPEGMAVILRTAGMEQDPPDIQRDLEYLLRLWDSIREQTLQSTAPSLIYEEANLIKRSVRDLYTQDIDEILVAGENGYQRAREFMRTIMPDEVEKIKYYEDPIPLFFRYHVENQIDSLHNPIVQLRSGGYIVINPTEALVAIDVNSGRATRERHIEETAFKTNLEAADEIARQLRLRDLAGLIVIDFIDMEDGRNNTAVERRLKEAMKNDRARLQIGRISPFGLLELSRQRLRPSLLEISFEKCPHCAGMGYVRSVDSASLTILRAIEEEGIHQRATELLLHVPTKIALYILNQKRETLRGIEQRYDLHVLLHSDDSLIPPNYKMERSRNRPGGRKEGPAVNTDKVFAEAERDILPISEVDSSGDMETAGSAVPEQGREDDSPQPYIRGHRRRFRQSSRDSRRNFGHRDRQTQHNRPPYPEAPEDMPPDNITTDSPDAENVSEPNYNVALESNTIPDPDNQQRRRRRGRRGGRRRNEGHGSHPYEGNNRWGKSHPSSGGQQQFTPPVTQEMGNFPASIHEIDTTPRPASELAPRSSGSYFTAPSVQKTPVAPRPGPASSSPHEIINPPSEKPKGGWWRKLTGQ